MTAERFDVVVVGAGLAGLAAAATAAGTGARTLVVDGHAPGGRASTDERNGYRFNRGGHALYQGGQAAAVLGRLGVDVAGAPPPLGGARGRLGGRVGLLPGDARFLAGARHWRPEEVAGLTVAEWLDGFDLPDDARAMVEMLVRLTGFVADHQVASADVPATQIPLGQGAGVLYLHGGWASLVDGLLGAARSRGVEIRSGGTITAVEGDGDSWAVHGGGSEVTARAVIVAAGGPAAARALIGPVEAWERLAPPVEASCLDLGLRQALRPAVLFGLDSPYYLVDQAAAARGLAPDGAGLVHVMHYLDAGDSTPAAALRAGLADHAAEAGIRGDDIVEERFLARMVVAGAHPRHRHRRPGRPARDRQHRAARPVRGRRLGGPVGLAGRRGPGQRGVGRPSRRPPVDPVGGDRPGPPGCGLMVAAAAPSGAAAEVFSAQRRRLIGVAYRITGSLSDAEDAVQEAWLRFERTQRSGVEQPAAWLTTTTARIALDQLKSARHRRETYVGPWLPEAVAWPSLTGAGAGAGADPAEAAELAQSLTLGFLHVLETLGPVDRVVFVLADVFAVPYREIADVVGRSESACRQIASRARRRIREAGPPPYHAPGTDDAATVEDLLRATVRGDIDRVVSLLADDAVLISDGGADHRAARRPVRGAARLARFLVNLAGRLSDATIEPVTLNGELGLVAHQDGERLAAMAIQVEDGKVRRIHVIRNPEKMGALDHEVDLV